MRTGPKGALGDPWPRRKRFPLQLHEAELAFLQRRAKGAKLTVSGLIIQTLRAAGHLPDRVPGYGSTGSWEQQERSQDRQPRRSK
jgi:hypothetical protein